MAESINVIPGNLPTELKLGILEQRRSLLLALLSGTPSENPALAQILKNDFLSVVKMWLDHILKKAGPIDLLLHLLTSIRPLPVSKDMVTSSKLGKLISSVEKHPICVGGQNESAIKQRVGKVKEAWSASVKLMRNNTTESLTQDKVSPNKRQLDFATSDKGAKKTRKDEPKKQTSFSNLLKKVSNSSTDQTIESNIGERTGKDPKLRTGGMRQEVAKNVPTKSLPRVIPRGVPSNPETTDVSLPIGKKQKRVRWADTAGGQLLESHEVDTWDSSSSHGSERNPDEIDPISLSDRRKKDRLHEKELLRKAKKAKINFEDEAPLFDFNALMRTWRPPLPLPPDPENPPVTVTSNEIVIQSKRMATVRQARYKSDVDVPNNPAPLSDIEQALDLTSQSSVTPGGIPFFTPQDEPEAAPMTPAPAVPQYPPPAPPGVSPPMLPPFSAPAPPPPPPPPTTPPNMQGASLETVQSLGLPLFLTGSNMQALQMLAASPDLLSTFVDSNGMYDQPRLVSLVNTLTQNLNPGQAVQQANPSTVPPPAIETIPNQHFTQFGLPQPTAAYGTNPPQANNYNANQFQQTDNGSYRGEQNGEGNLHVSGYGPSTTESDIITTFAPFVHVTEVVMKGSFAFVNTRDPDGAKRAKEALNGTFVSGGPLRINMAMRRACRDQVSVKKGKSERYQPPLPRNDLGQIEYDKVRDDRGNPATKNLFVAGFGSGTTEIQIRELFESQVSVTGCVLKGSFAFVNTSDRISAVHVREALTGMIVNGGALRINFAKETGRLGTSFDATYGPNTASRYMRR